MRLSQMPVAEKQFFSTLCNEPLEKLSLNDSQNQKVFSQVVLVVNLGKHEKRFIGLSKFAPNGIGDIDPVKDDPLINSPADGQLRFSEAGFFGTFEQLSEKADDVFKTDYFVDSRLTNELVFVTGNFTKERFEDALQHMFSPQPVIPVDDPDGYSPALKRAARLGIASMKKLSTSGKVSDFIENHLNNGEFQLSKAEIELLDKDSHSDSIKDLPEGSYSVEVGLKFQSLRPSGSLSESWYLHL